MAEAVSAASSTRARPVPLPAIGEARTVQQMVVAELRRSILDGTLAPGQRLRLDEIAASLRVSRVPVREALLQLQAEGFVRYEPHRGAVVVELEPEEIEELYVQRAALEAYAARLGVPRLTEEHFARLRALLTRMRELAVVGDREAFIEPDHEFHFTLYSAAGRDRLYQKLSRLWDASQNYIRRWVRSVPHARSWALTEHEELLRLAEQRDAEQAAALTQQHLLQIGLELAAFVRQNGQLGSG